MYDTAVCGRARTCHSGAPVGVDGPEVSLEGNAACPAMLKKAGSSSDADAEGEGHGGDESVAAVDAALEGEDTHAVDGHVDEQERRHAAQHAVCTVTQ